MSPDPNQIEPSERHHTNNAQCDQDPQPGSLEAIDRCTRCHVDRAYWLRRDAAEDAFQRVARGNGHHCHGPHEHRNHDEDGVPGAVTTVGGEKVRTGLYCFSKALKRRDPGNPVNFGGEPDPEAYQAMRQALASGSAAQLEQVPLTRLQPTVNPAEYRKLVNPQAGLAYDLEGPDSHGLVLPPAPGVTSPVVAAEMGELYWMAVLRDVHVKNYSASPTGDPAQTLVQTAAQHLSSKDHGGDFSEINWPPVHAVLPGNDQEPSTSHGRRQLQIPPFGSGRGSATPEILFRGFEGEVLRGPYLSQFLLRGHTDTFIDTSGTPALVVLQTPQDGFFSDGTGACDQRQKTVLAGPQSDFMTSEADWAEVQAGRETSGRDRIETTLVGGQRRARRRFIRSLRDLANYVHFCDVTTPYVNAAFIMINENLAQANRARLAGVDPVPPFPFNPGNPYLPANPADSSRTQVGFATFDLSHFLSVLDSVAWKAHKAEWFQKWFVHRRLRPEELGGRIHFQLAGLPLPSGTRQAKPYPALQGSEIIDALEDPAGLGAHFGPTSPAGTFLLPQAFPEGSPVHPAYGQGHAVVAGAAVTLLKSFFDDRAVMTDPTSVGAGDDGLPPAFVPDDAGDTLVRADSTQQVALTVGGELNKLAANISLGRDAAGVHFRTDYLAGVLLGEAVAIGVLLDQTTCYQAACTFNERTGAARDEPPFFEFTRFDGVRIRIAGGRVLVL
jgi:hypothetical protein